MATYKPTTNTVATYGESSPAVKALQESLIAKGAKIAADSKYGPLTEAAVKQYGGTSSPTPSPTPTGTDTTQTDVNRFIRTPNANDKEITDAEDRLSRTVTNEPDLASITAEKRATSQALIDSINAEFNKTLDAQGVTNAGLNDRVRALNVNAGLGGSDFGTAAAVGQEKKNAKAIEMIQAEKSAKINEVLAGIDERASEEYKARRLEYVQGLKDDITAKKNARDEDRKRAETSIASLANAGVSIDKLKTTDPTSYKTLLEEYGGSQIDLESSWNAALPDNMKVQYNQITKKGTDGNAVIVRYGINPVTGKTENKEYNLGIKYGDLVGAGEPELKEIDGRLWAVNRDSEGNMVAKPLTEVSELTKSTIAKNYAEAKNTTETKAGTFKFTGTQRSKLVSSNFNDEKINAIQADLQKYGVSAVLDGLSTDEEKNAVKESLKGSDLAAQLAEYAANNK